VEEERKKTEEEKIVCPTPTKKTEDDEKLEQNIEENLKKYRDELKLKIDKSNERVLGQADEFLKKKK
jgi:hypothetical protein